MHERSSRTRYLFLFASVVVLTALATSTTARENWNPKVELLRRGGGRALQSGPQIDYVAHSRGNIQLAIGNNGTFGTLGSTIEDPITGDAIPSCIYPKNSQLVYLWVAAVWIGAVQGRDTLVSVGNEDFYVTTEFWTDEYDFEEARPPKGFKIRSIDINSPFYHPDAVSEEDVICEYADTLDDPAIVNRDPFTNRAHIPLGIKVTQRSMAWSYSYADDFILFDYQVENILDEALNDIYIGIYVDGDAWHQANQGPAGWEDDICGFYPTHPAADGCGYLDTINVAYHMDNDGDPNEQDQWDEESVRSAVGVRVVRTPAEELEYSYNWWIIDYSDPALDFGPRQRGTAEDPFRSFGARLGTPTGDRNKYYMLRHDEFDYGQYFVGTIRSNDSTWLYPPQNYAEDWSNGYDGRYLLSFGPFDIAPGQKLPVSFAWLAGANVHQEPTAFEDMFESTNPLPFYNQLNFDSLAANSVWASWVYDNPGVDTDGDGYFGEFRVCATESSLVDTGDGEFWQIDRADTTWHKGDLVPDFRGAGPPPAPRARIIPGDGRLTLRWNGYYSETTEDVFLGAVDFEGYRVYLGRDSRPGAFSMIASFDRENYNRYRYIEAQQTWIIEETPFTLDSLRILFDDPDFDPLFYSRNRPFYWEGERYYFGKQDFNQSDLSSPTGIHKVYPDAPFPGTDPDLWQDQDLTSDYDEPLPKYYEYELVIPDLLNTVPYYLAVTSFDFGSPTVGLPALETNPTNNLYVDYPLPSAAEVEEDNLDVYVYPNPYRIDGGYRRLGFEGRMEQDRPDDRVRAIHFANLPAKCKISIFTLDGDLVAEIDHDRAPTDPESSHDEWNLITRNTQAVVSGLYYWVVESADRVQIGKFAIIK